MNVPFRSLAPFSQALAREAHICKPGRSGLPLASKRQRYLMALILAVDPEQRQHAALACLARELDGHELLSAASCADALAALDRRSPDLCSCRCCCPRPKRANCSRACATRAGTDIPALTIPQLKLPDAVAPPAPASTHPAWLNQILHPQDATEQPGEECEPAVFADLIRSYLGPVHDVVADAASAVADAARAAAERRRAHAGGGRARHRRVGPQSPRALERSPARNCHQRAAPRGGDAAASSGARGGSGACKMSAPVPVRAMPTPIPPCQRRPLRRTRITSRKSGSSRAPT